VPAKVLVISDRVMGIAYQSSGNHASRKAPLRPGR
jgi:hypothetical protein